MRSSGFTRVSVITVFILFVYMWSFIAMPNNALAFDPQVDCNKPLSSKAADPRFIICPFIRILNLGLYASGIALAIFIGYGAIKMSLALGDPKGLQGASKTWTFALIGFFIIVGSIFIISVTAKLFGNTSLSYSFIFNKISENWIDLLGKLGILLGK